VPEPERSDRQYDRRNPRSEERPVVVVTRPTLDEELETMFAGELHDAYPTLHRLMDESPVHWYGGNVIVSKHADVKEVYRDAGRFPQGEAWGRRTPELLSRLSNDDRVRHSELEAFTHSFVSRKNGDDHRRVRGAVHRYFTPARIEEMRVRIQQITDDMLASADDGILDAYSLAYQVPLRVIMYMLGVPDGEAETVKHYGDRLLPRPPTPENVRNAYNDLLEYRAWGHELIERHRRDAANDGIVTALLDASEGERITEDELVGFFMHTLMAGHETTAGQIRNGFRDLMRHRDQWDLLVDNPSLVTTAAEEILRFDTPVHYISNKATAVDVNIRGVDIPAGTQLMLGHASSNRDPDVFTDPDRFDLSRRPNDHLTLGFGVHFCLGANVARAELQVVFGTLARRYPQMELGVEPADIPVGTGLRLTRPLPVHLGRPRGA
jgi:cytochrome P450